MENQFIMAISTYNIPIPPNPLTEGRFTRWGKNGRYWAKKVENGYIFGDFAAGLSHSWFAKTKDKLPYGEYLARKREILHQQNQQIQQQQERWETVALKAQAIWQESMLLSATHPYLQKKKVKPFGLRCNQNRMIIPLQDSIGKIWSLQFTDTEGRKLFLSGGRTKGCFHSIADWLHTDTLYIVEGYATGATIHSITGKAVIVAFNAGNIDPVISSIMPYCRDKQVVIAADNDCHNDFNTGRQKAEAAARKYGYHLAMPVFGENSAEGGRANV